MGLEIRRVPKGWQHPTKQDASSLFGHRDRVPSYDPGPGKQWQPMFDQDWASAMRGLIWNWISWHARAIIAWPLAIFGLLDTTRYSRLSAPVRYRRFDDVLPDPLYYRPRWRKRRRTHRQLFETVSEGTPLSPPMPSADALAEWLSGESDVWPGTDGMTKDDWLKFMARGGWAPAIVVSSERGVESGVEFILNREE